MQTKAVKGKDLKPGMIIYAPGKRDHLTQIMAVQEDVDFAGTLCIRIVMKVGNDYIWPDDYFQIVEPKLVCML
jgi:hypothetical protein